MSARCGQCLAEIEENLGYETTRGDLLCGPCYFALWGPRGAHAVSRATDTQRPSSTRPKRGRPIWMPGPSGELDPQEPIRRKRSYR